MRACDSKLLLKTPAVVGRGVIIIGELGLRELIDGGMLPLRKIGVCLRRAEDSGSFHWKPKRGLDRWRGFGGPSDSKLAWTDKVRRERKVIMGERITRSKDLFCTGHDKSGRVGRGDRKPSSWPQRLEERSIRERKGLARRRDGISKLV